GPQARSATASSRCREVTSNRLHATNRTTCHSSRAETRQHGPQSIRVVTRLSKHSWAARRTTAASTSPKPAPATRAGRTATAPTSATWESKASAYKGTPAPRAVEKPFLSGCGGSYVPPNPDMNAGVVETGVDPVTPRFSG